MWVQNNFASIEQLCRILPTLEALAGNADLGEMVRLTQKGQRDCHFRMVLHKITCHTYSGIKTVVQVNELVSSCVELSPTDTVSAVDSACGARFLHLDLKLCHIVMDALLSNAHKFGRGGATLSVCTSEQDVQVRVWNAAGDGHAAWKVRHSAQPESTASGSGRQMHGLSVCSPCVRHAGWQLQCNVDDEGTTFSIVMPLSVLCRDMRLIAQHQKQREQSASSSTTPTRALGAWVKVAVLEDTKVVRMLCNKVLTAMRKSQMIGSFFVDGATSDEVHGFVQRCMQEDVHVALFDQDLSSVLSATESKYTDGTTLMQELRSLGFKGLCVTKTADAEMAAGPLLEAGFDCVLPKNGDLAQQLSDAWHQLR